MFHCTQPCGNCPYRTDVPVRHWDKYEFEKLLNSETDQFGAVYNCHKNNGSICVGWLMKQDENRLPSISLRISLSKHGITRDYIDKLHSPVPLYKSVRQMIKANFPTLLNKRKKTTT